MCLFAWASSLHGLSSTRVPLCTADPAQRGPARAGHCREAEGVAAQAQGAGGFTRKQQARTVARSTPGSGYFWLVTFCRPAHVSGVCVCFRGCTPSRTLRPAQLGGGRERGPANGAREQAGAEGVSHGGSPHGPLEGGKDTSGPRPKQPLETLFKTHSTPFKTHSPLFKTH